MRTRSECPAAETRVALGAAKSGAAINAGVVVLPDDARAAHPVFLGEIEIQTGVSRRPAPSIRKSLLKPTTPSLTPGLATGRRP